MLGLECQRPLEVDFVVRIFKVSRSYHHALTSKTSSIGSLNFDFLMMIYLAAQGTLVNGAKMNNAEFSR